jgi:trigger factor
VETKLTVEIIEVNSCKRNLAVEVPAQELEQEIEKIAREHARNAKIPGFRPGKAPLNIIRQRYGSDLLQDATQNIMDRCWKDAIREHDLHPLARPVIKDIENKPGNPLKFTVEFEILPELEVKDYKGVTVTQPSSEISDEDVGRSIENLREQHAQFAPVEEEAARDGMYLTLTIDGQIEGETKPIHDDDVIIILGHPQTYPDFSKSLLGARPGDMRTFEVSYPEDHQQKRFAGKNVRYTVLVKDIKEKQLAELNDDFAKDIGSESLEALRTKVRDELVTEAKQNAEKRAREALLDAIMERQTFEVPECMVQDELELHARRVASNLAYQGYDLNQTPIDWKKMFDEERPHAERSVRRAILLDAIARQEDIKVTDEEMESEFQKLAKGTNKSAAAWRAQFEKEDRIQSFEQHLRQNKALDFIYRNANINVG